MVTKEIKLLLGKLNSHVNVAVEAAAGFCVQRTNYEVFPDHLLLKLLEEGTGDIPLILLIIFNIFSYYVIMVSIDT